MKSRFALCALLLALCLGARGQNAAFKTNLLYDATASVAVGAEFGLAPKWTFDLSGSFNGWDIKEGKHWRHIMVQPEARYWFCDRFAGGFLGLHLLGGVYNMGGIKIPAKLPIDVDLHNLEDFRYKGWFAGAGIAYGYAFVLGKHWNLELELGAGYVYTKYDQYVCEQCGEKTQEDQYKHYIGPTKAAVNVVYVF